MTGLNPFQHGVIEAGMMVMDDKFDYWRIFYGFVPTAKHYY